MTKIYTLEHPITKEVRYVGKTIDSLNNRLSQHIYDSKRRNTKSLAWIKSILKQGLKPIINIIDEVPNEEFAFWEQYWISQFKVWGFRLTNHTIGGEGALGYRFSEEQKLNLKNRRHSEKTKQFLSTLRKGAKHTEESKEKMKWSEERRIKRISQINIEKEQKYKAVRHKITKKEYKCIDEVSKETGLSYVTLYTRIRNNYKCNEYEYI